MPQRAEILARRRVLEQRARARQELRLFARRLEILLGALVALILAGTLGFAWVERTSPGYAFEWTLDTITTGVLPAARRSRATWRPTRPKPQMM